MYLLCPWAIRRASGLPATRRCRRRCVVVVVTAARGSICGISWVRRTTSLRAEVCWTRHRGSTGKGSCNICVCICVYTHTHTHTHTHTVCVCVYVYTYTYVCIHTYTYIRTYRFVKLTNYWNDTSGLATEEYRDMLLRSRITLCPRGFVHPESFRLSEALETGRSLSLSLALSRSLSLYNVCVCVCVCVCMKVCYIVFQSSRETHTSISSLGTITPCPCCLPRLDALYLARQLTTLPRTPVKTFSEVLYTDLYIVNIQGLLHCENL